MKDQEVFWGDIKGCKYKRYFYNNFLIFCYLNYLNEGVKEIIENTSIAMQQFFNLSHWSAEE
jgi:hypothetical protein